MATNPRRAPLALLLIPLLGCGEGPEKLSRADIEAQRSGGGAPAGSEQPSGLPPNHPPLTQEPPMPGHPPVGGHPPAGTGGDRATALEGVVELAGPLADLESGSIYVVGYDRASGEMALVKKYGIDEAIRAQPGEARLSFSLDQVHPSAGGALEELDLEVRIDLDGFVDTPADDVVARTRVPVRLGDRDVRVRLDETARTEVPLPGGGG